MVDIFRKLCSLPNFAERSVIDQLTLVLNFGVEIFKQMSMIVDLEKANARIFFNAMEELQKKLTILLWLPSANPFFEWITLLFDKYDVPVLIYLGSLVNLSLTYKISIYQIGRTHLSSSIPSKNEKAMLLSKRQILIENYCSSKKNHVDCFRCLANFFLIFYTNMRIHWEKNRFSMKGE